MSVPWTGVKGAEDEESHLLPGSLFSITVPTMDVLMSSLNKTKHLRPSTRPERRLARHHDCGVWTLPGASCPSHHQDTERRSRSSGLYPTRQPPITKDLG
ncbi:hypothetical protein H1C71_001438 [Ictidomys tridecemlineatus]|nr:hypothetical protein H1C71_001438 [Ictidomys tridecemlineatus]